MAHAPAHSDWIDLPEPEDAALGPTEPIADKPPPNPYEDTRPASTAEQIELARHYNHRGQMMDDGYENWAPPIASKAEVAFRHGHWQEKRDRLREAIAASPLNGRRLERWDNCGACATIEYSAEAKKYRVACWQCKDRMCGPCQKRKAAEIAHVIKTNLAGKPGRLVTLTLDHRPETLRQAIRRLRDGFQKLKRSKWWKAHIIGGIAVLEVKKNAEGAWQDKAGKWYHGDGLWHAHFHIVTTGSYIPIRELKDAWYAATGSAFIVDVRFVKDPDRASYYLSKYVTKPAPSSTYDDAAKLIELIEGMKGQRVYNVFGTWRHTPKWQPNDDVKDWTPVMSIAQLLHDRNKGDPNAQRIFNELMKKPAADPPQDTS